MRFSYSWLKDHLDTTVSAQEIADKLVDLGVEVEALEDQAEQFNKVVIGHVLERTQHPDADKLGVCIVEVGEDEPRQIVCGAPNVRAGLTVAVALDGACLPGDFVIKKSKIRGVTSNGMICSARELGLGDEHDGIMELEIKAESGTAFAEAMGMGDVVFDVSITPNRADVLSVYGIARDLAAADVGTLKAAPSVTLGSNKPSTSVSLETENCMFFTGIEIKGVKNCESPTWLKNKIEAAGLRSKDAIVDISNFVMMDLGQPSHAYDADKLSGNIVVKSAKGGEEFQGVVGDSTYSLNEDDVIITDDSGIIGLGAILGGESTAVDENTSNVYLEAAWFDRSRIARSGQAHQINSDARYRSERGLDPQMTATAAAYAAKLIVDICGGELSAIDEVGNNTKDVPIITLDPKRVETFGGLAMDTDEITSHLNKLGFDVKTDGAMLQVTPPSFRTYMTTPEDLIEEVLRLKGFDNIPSVVPDIPEHATAQTPTQLAADRMARRQFVSAGFVETINYSFISKENAEQFSEGKEVLELANPIDEEGMSTMRPSLIPSLLDAASRNAARSETAVNFAEVGRVYTKGEEHLSASALRMGANHDKHWNTESSKTSAFATKADLNAMIASFGYNPEMFQVRTGAPGYYHPGRSGIYALGKDTIATFGEIHPSIAKQFDIKETVAVFEINLDRLTKMKAKTKAFQMSQYQATTKDLAFLVDKKVPAGDVLISVQRAEKTLLKDARIFDVYEGDNLPEGKKSIAITMTLQSMDKTLSDNDIKSVMDKAAQFAQKNCGAELRDS